MDWLGRMLLLLLLLLQSGRPRHTNVLKVDAIKLIESSISMADYTAAYALTRGAWHGHNGW